MTDEHTIYQQHPRAWAFVLTTKYLGKIMLKIAQHLMTGLFIAGCLFVALELWVWFIQWAVSQ